MTYDEYAMLRSIAAADGTSGPNFDPALLTELLDAWDTIRVVKQRYPLIWRGLQEELR